MSRNNRPPRRTFGRLSLERLEAREVPAAYFWRPTILEQDGVTYSSAVAGN